MRRVTFCQPFHRLSMDITVLNSLPYSIPQLFYSLMCHHWNRHSIRTSDDVLTPFYHVHIKYDFFLVGYFF